ncbi:MAG: nicotinate-nucleotide adenylyltransferase [Aestuariivita sp.]|nr:nicotinate-nucleotide adenylyltransferase [Aestuariivita sp.]
MFVETPIVRPRQLIGLLGGSFDPAHAGHIHISYQAIKRFGLTHVWWLVTPGNPLKIQEPAPMEQRLREARNLVRHPRIIVTDIEAKLNSTFTAETLQYFRIHFSHSRFVWLMGADNLVQFHQWQAWTQIMNFFPVGIIARPGDQISARLSRAARLYRKFRLSERQSKLLGRSNAPAWCFVNGPMVEHSSSKIRARENRDEFSYR